MKHLKLFLALLALVGVNLTANAQKDVTAKYLTNADFSQGTPITVGVCTYQKDAAGNNTQYSQLVAVKDWDIPANGDARAGGLVAFGSGVWIGGPGYTAPATNSDGDTEGNILGVVAVWSGTAQYTQDVTLPAGTYTLVLAVYNSVGGTTAFTKNLIGFIEDGGTEHLATTTVYSVNTWKYEFVTFTLDAETSGKFSLGYQGSDVGSAKAQHLFLSGIQLFEGEVDAEAYEAAKEAARNEKELEANKEKLEGSSFSNPSADLLINGSFDTADSGWTLNNMGYQQNGERPTRYVEKWQGSALTGSGYATQTIKNMPAGAYILKGTVHTNQAENGGTTLNVNNESLLVSGSWTEYEITYNLEADGDLTVAFNWGNLNSNWIAIDDFSLVYGGPYDQYIADKEALGHKKAWDEALAAAQDAVANTDYANVTGEECTALNAEIAKDEPTTADGYDAATEALKTATRVFTEAKDFYDAFVKAKATTVPELAYAAEAKKTALTEAIAADAATNAADATAKANAIVSGLRAYYESHALAEGVEGAVNMTDKIANATDPTNNDGWTWTGNKNNPASNEPWTDADGTNTHSYFDGGNWGSNSWTTTMKQTVTVPAGKYLLTAKARAASNVTFTMAVGEASVALPNVGNTGNVFDRGWGDASVEFETDGSGAEIVVTASSNTIHEWFSISNFRLVQLEAIEVPMADAADYAELAAAISAAEANTLGFDADEYAPYNNVAALQALAVAKAINPEAEDGNTKEVVQNATSALTEAAWTPNTEEVNAVHNGMFATVQDGANYPEGWNRTNAWGQMQSNIAGDYATAYYNQPGSLKYGENGVYTMPLKENTVYVLNFVYRAHENGSNNKVTVSVLNGEDGVKDVVCPGNGSTSEWKTGSVVFTTGAAGNYVLTLANDGNTWMTNVSIFRAQSVDITVKEGFTATTYSNADYALDFSNTEGLTAAIITDAEGTEVEVDDAPAGTGLYVKAEPGTYQAYILGASYTNVSDNKLVGTGSESPSLTSNESTTYYVFGRQGTPKKEAFYKVKTDKATKVSANKAYLKIDVPASGAKDAIFVGGGETNGINAIDDVDMQNGNIYNLQGQKVNHAQKGVYIVNGKKIVLK